MGSFVRARGIALLQYIDDWNVQSRSSTSSARHADGLLQLTQGLGLLVNFPKSDLVPSQGFTFVGISFDLLRGMAVPAEHRVEAFQHLCELFLRINEPPARMWLKVLGHLTSLEKLVPRGRLRMRPVQFALQDSWTMASDSMGAPVPHTAEAREAIRW